MDKILASIMALTTYPLGIEPTRLQRVATVMQQFGLLKQHFNIQALLS